MCLHEERQDEHKLNTLYIVSASPLFTKTFTSTRRPLRGILPA
jgi:hypothetical protein